MIEPMDNIENILLTGLIAKLRGQKYPWKDAIDFFENPDFLGAELFPAQRLLLKLWNLQTDFTDWEKRRLEEWTKPGLQTEDEYKSGVQGDVLDRIAALKKEGREWFPQIVAVMGRRAGKTFLTGLQLSYCTACFLWENGWRGGNAVTLGHSPDLMVIATTAEQAKGTIFTDFYNAVLANDFFKPYIVRASTSHVEFADLETQQRQAKLDVKLEHPLLSLRARPISSNTASSRGWPMPFFAFDEAFFALQGESSRSGDAAIQALLPAQTQFYPHEIAIFPSSPWRRGGALYEIYEGGLATKESGNWDPGILVCQMESWKMYE